MTARESVAKLRLSTLRLEQTARTVVARFDNPPFNYMTAELLRDLDDLTAAADRDESVGAVILTGGPPDRFITHFDVAELLEGSERAGRSFAEPVTRAGLRVVEAANRLPGGDQAIERLPLEGAATMRRFADVALRIRGSGVVYIAAINGPCGGGGLELVLSFDVRLAADSGVVVGLPELLIGLTTSVGGQRLAQLMGPTRALEMMLEGRLLEPDEALEANLLSRLVPREELLGSARALAARWARRDRNVVAAQKRILFEHALEAPEECHRREAAASLAATTSEPTRRALRAFVAAQRRVGGDSPFLADIEPWVEGAAVEPGP